MDQNKYSIRESILTQTKRILEQRDQWLQFQSEIVQLLIDLPEYVIKSNKQEVIKKLDKIKRFLNKEVMVPNKYLQYIDDEKFNIKELNQMYFYKNIPKTIPEAEIKSFVKVGFGTEGVIGIPQRYNYHQIAYLVNKVWNTTSLAKFYISRERTILGRIIAEVFETAQMISVAKVISKRRMDDLEDSQTKIILFGEYYDPKHYSVIKDIEVPMYVYRFMTNEHEECILLCPDRQELGEKIVTGMSTFRYDVKNVTDTSKLPTKLMYFFSQDIESKIAKFTDPSEFKTFFKRKIPDTNMLNRYPFSYSEEPESKKYILLAYPTWYKTLIWAWLLHQKKGKMGNKFPLNFLIIGDRGSGKSTILNLLHSKSMEQADIFSGSGSTIKALIPSFKTTPPKVGYLAESNRFAFLDEFFRAIMRQGKMDENADSLSLLNDLLEHQKRGAGSGNGNVNTKMRARVIATTNPVREGKDMKGLLKVFDTSFISRWLILFQPKELVDLARKTDEEDLEVYTNKIENTDFITILDYIQDISATYDKKIMREIFEKFEILMSGDLQNHYYARHKHFIECLLDGIVKYRCIIQKKFDFIAIPEDYNTLRIVWHKIITSWFQDTKPMNIDVYDRIDYMPEPCQYLFWKIAKEETYLDREEITKLAEGELSKRQVLENLIILIDNELLFETGGKLYTFMKNKKLSENEIEKANTYIRIIQEK